jgi:hypothetical protein
VAQSGAYQDPAPIVNPSFIPIKDLSNQILE